MVIQGRRKTDIKHEKNTKSRLIIVINLLRHGIPEEVIYRFEGVTFTVVTHNIGWDLQTAKAIIKKFDGYADGIAISGNALKAEIGRTEIINRETKDLIRNVTKSNIYVGNDLRKLFANWTIKRVVQSNPQFFNAKNVLFHCAALSPFLNTVVGAGANMIAADSLLLTGLPVKFTSVEALAKSIQTAKPLIEKFSTGRLKKMVSRKDTSNVQNRLRTWIREADIFVSFGSIIDQIGSYDVLKGKTLLIDYLPEKVKEEITKSGVAQILELAPEIPGLYHPGQRMGFSVLQAIIDQLRIAEDSPLLFDDYAIRLIQKKQVKPRGVEYLRPAFQKCAFIIHPLQQRDLFLNPKFKMFTKAPEAIRSAFEKGAAYLPPLYHGSISGIKSKLTGQEILCELYAIPATPKEMLSLDVDFVYKRLTDITKMAHANGCSMIGLGAYTKVVGDSGITISKRSPIPVTNGNSYSASATLWAARIVTEKVSMISKQTTDGKLDAQAAVIGATGSIGRVSSMLLATVFKNLILVATQADKLLELQEEILKVAPNCNVIIATSIKGLLNNTDLIVTATSARGQKVIDIEQCKPGAVICDCSRPLDVGADDAAKRPDVMVIESGEIDLPGNLHFTCDIGLPGKSVYACLAETALLTLEGKMENFSLGRNLSMRKVKDIYQLGVKHGADLSAIRGPLGFINDDDIEKCRLLAQARMKMWNS